MENFAGADLHKKVTQLAVLRERRPPSQYRFAHCRIFEVSIIGIEQIQLVILTTLMGHRFSIDHHTHGSVPCRNVQRLLKEAHGAFEPMALLLCPDQGNQSQPSEEGNLDGIKRPPLPVRGRLQTPFAHNPRRSEQPPRPSPVPLLAAAFLPYHRPQPPWRHRPRSDATLPRPPPHDRRSQNTAFLSPSDYRHPARLCRSATKSQPPRPWRSDRRRE